MIALRRSALPDGQVKGQARDAQVVSEENPSGDVDDVSGIVPQMRQELGRSRAHEPYEPLR